MTTESYKLRYWVAAARPVGHGMIALPLLWGQALALVVTGTFDWLWFVAIHVFGMLCQVYSLYLNDYADESLDRSNQSYWLSGGSRVIPDGHLSGQQLYAASFVALCGLVLVSATAYYLGRVWMPVFGSMAIILGWTYSLAPVKSSYFGYGEMHQGLACGAFLPIAAFYLQTGSIAGFSWWLLLPVCVIFFAGNIITALPDTASDHQGGKLSYPVRHGEKRARRDALLLLLLAYLLVVVVSAPWIAWHLTCLVIAGPAVAVLFHVYQSGLVRDADSSNRPLCKRFILFTTLSQLWVMLTWLILFICLGLQNA